MSSDISVGTAVQSGSTTIVTGTISGLQTDQLIENAVSANNEKADLIDVDISENADIISAYDELYTLSDALQTSLESLKSVTGFSGDSNVFSNKSGTISSNGTNPDGLISVNIDSDAAIGENVIVVEQIAKAFSITSTDVMDKDAELSTTGSFEIGLSGYDAATIDVTTDMSLQDIADQINDSSEISGVEASILKVSESEYQLVLTGTQTNKDITVTTLSGSILQDLGIVDGSDLFVEDQIVQEAQGSRVLLNGTTITRDDNLYDDLIEGVEINLLGADEGTEITLNINADTSGAKTAIEDFIEAYNALRDFLVLNQTVESDGSIPDDAYLYGEPAIDTMAFELSSVLGSAFGEDGSAASTLRDIGIVFDDENRLEIDDETLLDSALINNFDDISALFSSSFTTSSSELGLISNTSTQGDLAFDLVIDIDEETGEILSALVNGSASGFEVSGASIIGKEGTIYEGLRFAFAGDEDETVSVKIGSGMADKLYNYVDQYTNPTDGLIQTESQKLQSENDALETEAEEIRARGEEIREQQIEKYSKMESDLALIESLRNTLSALLGTDDD